MNLPHVIIITGPTASGKTSVAARVAKTLGCHVICADSRQVYTGMPITTAVPTAQERMGVEHHLLEFLAPDAYYSAAMFRNDALELINGAAHRGDRHIVVCGGSMMYVDALIYGLDNLPTISPEVRERVKELYDTTGLEGVFALLTNLDPVHAAKVDPSNPRRVMHAVEVCLQAGQPYSALISQREADPGFTYDKYYIHRERQDLFNRINARVDMMVEQGMEQEARAHYHLRHLNALNTIGFKEWFAYFDGLMTREEAIARIAKNTRVFAKKQLTWLARPGRGAQALEPDTAVEYLSEKYLS